jgi:hypothetical protein
MYIIVFPDVGSVHTTYELEYHARSAPTKFNMNMKVGDFSIAIPFDPEYLIIAFGALFMFCFIGWCLFCCCRKKTGEKLNQNDLEMQPNAGPEVKTMEI